jgi:uncharacterized protein (DUF1919 family)
MLGSAARHVRRKLRHLEKHLLKRTDFSIISNNCWGGFVYQYYGLPYRTPFIGLFLFPSDYLKLLQNLRHYLDQDLVFIGPDQTRYRDDLIKWNRLGAYPIGRLDDIEIHFQHFTSDREAREKWTRRLSRLNAENLIVKFCDRDGCTRADIALFDALPYERKICMTAKAYPYTSCLELANCDAFDMVEDEWVNFRKTVRLTPFMNRFYP